MTDIVFAYHDVGPRAPGDRFTVEPAVFSRHLDAIVESNANVTLTFDDGRRCALDVIAPLLEERSLRGSFFMITKSIGIGRSLSADALRELHERGHVVGSHTHTHPGSPYLRQLRPAQIDDEWQRSKAVLEDVLGAPVDQASVPHGATSRVVAGSAAAAGYRKLYTSRPHVGSRRVGELEVRGRFSVAAGTAPSRIAAICDLEPGALRREAARWVALELAKRGLGPLYLVARRNALTRFYR
jgi:peptidoglycan/xylan/chitin deacetylase (PgdA/CDA1 family)